MSQSGPNTQRLREIALALPETHEELTWGEDVNFRVGKKIFLFPGDEAMTFKADPSERDALLADGRCRVAAYVGRFGWLTMDLPKRPTKAQWAELAELVTTSYALIAPKRLAKLVRPT
jgi:predicted DNA-binding protein (MmcQ/YjbR family)